MRLSIIIPVYNAQDYLIRCLESVFSQELLSIEYEVIVINDGSKDNSLAILEDFKKKHSNLIVLTQENSGEAITRNRALSIAKGNYIAFVDADDAIETNTFKTILERAESEQLDILYLKMDLYDDKGVFISQYPAVGEEFKIRSGFEHPRRTFPATLYLKEITTDLFFDKEIIIGPDSVFNAMAQTRAIRCSYCAVPHYKYTFRLDSLSKQGHTDKAYLGFLKAIKTLVNFKNTYYTNASKIENDYFNTVISIFITRIVELNILPTLNKNRFLELKEVLSSHKMSYLIDNLSTKFIFINSNFTLFYIYNISISFKNAFYLMAHNIKKSIKRSK